MDMHRRNAAWLAIIMGGVDLLVLAFLAIVLILMGGALALLEPHFLGLASLIGGAVFALFFLFFGVFGIADILAGYFYLKGAAPARVWLIITNAINLLGFPIGTLIGAYSLWAILREPAPEALQRDFPGRAQAGVSRS